MNMKGVEIASIDLNNGATLGDLKEEYKKKKRVGVERQAFYMVKGKSDRL